MRADPDPPRATLGRSSPAPRNAPTVRPALRAPGRESALVAGVADSVAVATASAPLASVIGVAAAGSRGRSPAASSLGQGVVDRAPTAMETLVEVDLHEDSGVSAGGGAVWASRSVPVDLREFTGPPAGPSAAFSLASDLESTGSR